MFFSKKNWHFYINTLTRKQMHSFFIYSYVYINLGFVQRMNAVTHKLAARWAKSQQYFVLRQRDLILLLKFIFSRNYTICTEEHNFMRNRYKRVYHARTAIHDSCVKWIYTFRKYKNKHDKDFTRYRKLKML